MGTRKKYDDFYSNGKFELGRIGRLVSLKSHLTSQEIHTRNQNLIAQYETVKKEIDLLVSQIREDISKCDPLAIMMCATDTSMTQLIHLVSDYENVDTEDYSCRIIEYIQSILVSQCPGEPIGDDETRTQLMYSIFAQIEELYDKCRYFHIIWAAKAKEEGLYNSDEIQYIIESQLMSNVRGNRYQYFQLKDMEDLLVPHTEKLLEIYGLSGHQVIEGLKKLEYSLSSAKLDAFKGIANGYEQFRQISEEKNETEIVSIMTEIRKNVATSELFSKCFGTDLYDVKKVTGWPEKLVDSLALELGEDCSYVNRPDFAGWPFQDLPVQKKPFIKIDGITYCFDYYTLFDNIYRAIQKNLRDHDRLYVNQWSKIQQEASESIVAKKFQTLLPGASVYIGNYYPIGKSLKQMDENDILVIYDDVVIVAEVKAGSFTYTPAISDFEAHRRSFESLIEKANYQCSRTVDYILSNDSASFYDEKKNWKFQVQLPRTIYSFCVTIDNFDVFAAKIEKTRLFSVSDGTIAIGLDDLDVYEEYFISPLQFLHYIKQRRDATRIRHLMLNDELDHLGLYIAENMYRNYINEYRDCDSFTVTGYRDDLNAYYNGLHQEALQIDKPEQKIPKYIKQILEYMEQNNLAGRVKLAEFLLDMSTDARNQFSDTIEGRIKRIAELGYVSPFWVEGDFAYCCFVKVPGVDDFAYEKRIQYAYTNMRDRKRDSCWLLNVDVDNFGNLIHFEWEELLYADMEQRGMTETEIEAYSRYLSEQRKRAGVKMLPVKKQKIYPNEPCPCGSGKKYKKCCGRS